MTVDAAKLSKAVEWGCAAKLEGKSFCLTGAMSLTRKEMELVITTLGGEAHDSVKKSTDFLVVPTDPEFRKGSKYRAAKAQGVVILSEEQFAAMLLPSLEDLLG